jgi:hypothetical protein
MFINQYTRTPTPTRTMEASAPEICSLSVLRRSEKGKLFIPAMLDFLDDCTKDSKGSLLMNQRIDISQALPSVDEGAVGNMYFHMANCCLCMGTWTLKQVIFIIRWTCDMRSFSEFPQQKVLDSMKATEEDVKHFLLDTCSDRYPTALLGSTDEQDSMESTVLLLSPGNCMDVCVRRSTEIETEGHLKKMVLTICSVKIFDGDINRMGMGPLRRHSKVPGWKTCNQLDRRLAVAMSQEKRLGKHSLLNLLDIGVLTTICKFGLEYTATPEEVDNMGISLNQQLQNQQLQD